MKKMRFTALALVLCLFTGCVSTSTTTTQTEAATKELVTAAADYNSIFQGDKVIDVKVSLEDSDYQDMLDNAEAEEYKSATITVDGNTVENVGFRTKGNLTLRSVASSDSDRYSFRVKLDKYVKGQSLMGLDEFVLNNMYSDASYLREYLSYEALRSIGIDVPQCVFVNLYINDELKGLYLAIEAIDDSYIERAFGNTEGNLYKAEMGSSLVYKENDNYESLELKMGDDKEKAGLKNMISILNSGNKEEIEKVLDVSSALKYIAFNYVFGNYDSYIGMQQNYYLYEDNGIFKVIPWDFNMAFGGQGGGRGASEVTSPAQGDNYPLVTKLLAIDEYKTEYLGYVEELLSYCDNVEARVNELKALIYDYVKADPTKFCTIEDFDKATSVSTEENSEENIPESDLAQGNPPEIPQGDVPQGNPPDMPQGNVPQGNPPDMPQGNPPQVPNGNMPKRERPDRNTDTSTEATPKANKQNSTVAAAKENNQGSTDAALKGNNKSNTDTNTEATPRGEFKDRGGMKGGKNMNNTNSIISYITNRAKSIRNQLSDIENNKVSETTEANTSTEATTAIIM